MKISIISSEIYAGIDAIYYDDMSSDSTSNYYFNSNNSVLTYSDNALILTSKNTSVNSQYIDKRGLTDSVKGKTIQMSVDVVPNNCRVRIDIYIDGTRYASSQVASETTLEHSVDIPSTANDVFFRLTVSNFTTGSLTFKNFVIYPI